MVFNCLALLGFLAMGHRAAVASPPVLEATVQGSDLILSWHAVPANPGSSTPVTLGFQLEQSGDAKSWSAVGEPVPTRIGGDTLTYERRLPMSEGTQFFRLQYHLHVPGNQDLRGMDLRGVNFDRANLAGADLTGANLAGASLVEANLGGTILDDADLTGTRFGPQSEHRYVMNRFGEPATALVADLPDLPFYAEDADYVLTVPDFEDLPTSERTLVIVLKSAANVGDVNALLAAHGGTVAGVLGNRLGLDEPMVSVRFSTTASTIGGLRATLEAHPAVAEVLYDMAHSERVLPSYTGLYTMPNWNWTGKDVNDWNWGLEWARVPAMWNLNDGVDRLRRLRGNAPSMFPPVLVLDNGFDLAHPDLAHATSPFSLSGTAEHGTHVAGIVGAQFSWPHPRGGFGGMEGVDPYCNLHVATFTRTQSTFKAQLLDLEWAASMLGARVVNCSYGFSWSTRLPSGAVLVRRPESRPGVRAEMVRWAVRAGLFFARLRAHGNVPLVVIAAGNDGVDSQWGGALEHFSRVAGSDDIVIVGAQDLNSDAMASYSNTNVEMLAPGSGIGSTLPNGRYNTKNGTSMAAPHVTGLASYLVHLNPALTNNQLNRLLTLGQAVGPDGAEAPVMDAFASALMLDTIAPPPEASVRKLLLDIDDGTPDGNLRMRYEADNFDPDLPLVRTDYRKPWTTATSDPGGYAHPESIALDGPGDGRIDMSDFRRWRDWLLRSENNPALMLDGAPDHPKFDGNGDGEVKNFLAETYYARGDFNGDSFLSRTRRAPPYNLTDLEMLMTSGLWADPYVDVADLPNLIDSGDLRVVTTEYVFEFTNMFSAVRITIANESFSTIRTIEHNDPRMFWNCHHQDFLFTVPTGVYEVLIEFLRGRNSVVATFYGEDVSVGLGEDVIYIMEYAVPL